mmetsp:Transcript_65497/g.195828  ORF Transcript_65497/g.195828 Transcript_65497/m.195828 type:complete len:212 (+) Transcript_65497:173-808(+)
MTPHLPPSLARQENHAQSRSVTQENHAQSRSVTQWLTDPSRSLSQLSSMPSGSSSSWSSLPDPSSNRTLSCSLATSPSCEVTSPRYMRSHGTSANHGWSITCALVGRFVGSGSSRPLHNCSSSGVTSGISSSPAVCAAIRLRIIVSSASEAPQGDSPVASSKSSAPTDHMSDAGLCGSPRSVSGATPETGPQKVKQLPSSRFAQRKSLSRA